MRADRHRPGDRGAVQLDLVPDCARCFGLCCVAQSFQRSRDFSFDKEAGEPCRHLDDGFRCAIHGVLRTSGMAGCSTYECFGAGQQVSQVTYAGSSWRDRPELAEEMFGVFLVVRGLHEMLSLLDQALALAPSKATEELRSLIAVAADGAPPDIIAIDLDRLRARTSEALGAASRLVRGSSGEALAGADLAGQDLRARALAAADLRGALLMAADLRGVSLARADLLGADLRDAQLGGADLADALFVTQPQLNAARGSATTQVPPSLSRPPHW